MIQKMNGVIFRNRRTYQSVRFCEERAAPIDRVIHHERSMPEAPKCLGAIIPWSGKSACRLAASSRASAFFNVRFYARSHQFPTVSLYLFFLFFPFFFPAYTTPARPFYFTWCPLFLFLLSRNIYTLPADEFSTFPVGREWYASSRNRNSNAFKRVKLEALLWKPLCGTPATATGFVPSLRQRLDLISDRELLSSKGEVWGRRENQVSVRVGRKRVQRPFGNGK